MNIALNIELTVDQLIKGCIAGNSLQQKYLYELFHGKMLGVCMRYARDREEAQDMVNEGFYKVFKNLHKFRADHPLESWVRRIMINTAIDHYRKNKKHRHVSDIADNYDRGVQESVSSKLGAEELLKLVQRLTPGYRAVFSLYAIDGFNHREVSERLGISEGTSKSNLAKARQKLQTMLKELDQ